MIITYRTEMTEYKLRKLKWKVVKFREWVLYFDILFFFITTRKKKKEKKNNENENFMWQYNLDFI